MPTPRSEALQYYRSGATSIRTPESAHDPINKQEHFAVLAQVIDVGIAHYLTDLYTPAIFAEAKSLPTLTDIFRTEINNVLVNTLESKAFKDHFMSLHESQISRHQLLPYRWNDIKDTIRAGATTFSNSFEYIFDFLKRHYGIQMAGSPENWRIADRLAKLDIDQFAAYYTTYLTEFQNWPFVIDHLRKTPEGGLRFKPGYPEEAYVTEKIADPASRIIETKDFMLDGSQPLVQIKDVPSRDGAVGCPVTFSPQTIKSLWQLYAAHAHHLVTTPPVTSSDDSEASRP